MFARLILESEHVVALTGAGMSTESGIPDFRSPGTGLWERVDPNEFGTIDSYVSNANKNLKTMMEFGVTIFRAKANSGHKALTRLQKLGKLNGIITQNIDGLHQKAHSKNIIEMHGNVNEGICMECGSIYPITTMVNQVLKGGSPSCEKCKGLLKPNSVFFGEPLNPDNLEAADKLISNCDFLMMLGSSLVVYPVAFYPQKALMSGAKLGMINIQETDQDENATVVIHGKIGDVLPQIVEIVEKDLTT